MERLTGNEYAVLIDSLTITRDKIRGEGRETPTIDSALAKITKGCTPSTTGLEFRLIDASEAA